MTNLLTGKGVQDEGGMARYLVLPLIKGYGIEFVVGEGVLLGAGSVRPVRP